MRSRISQELTNLKTMVSGIKQEIKGVELSDMYSVKYQTEEIAKLKQKIKQLQDDFPQAITGIVESEIAKVPNDINKNTEIQTSNILNMLNITRDNIASGDLQKFLDDNYADPLVRASIESIYLGKSEIKNYFISIPPLKEDKIAIINENASNFMSTLGGGNFKGLSPEIALNYFKGYGKVEGDGNLTNVTP